MTDSENFRQFGPRELIEQAQDIIMNDFGLDAAQALGVLRKMSQHTRTQMCVVAEAIINHAVPDEAEAKRILLEAAHG
ncbi:MAG TPA: ANTAR domain-containing protein [Mycobacterium sp.]|jgi:AmiR/NasT family two-component response regulator|nr:ANTAR domain-containing protein [Mycobacterium sp.]